MVVAALLVRLMWLRAILYFSFSSNTLDTVTTRIEIRKAPQKAVIIAIHLPGLVEGVTSPYPTVVIVVRTHHIELKYESNSLFSFALK